eukprot:1146914-Pelagomonas_calceolata.AAC.3
MIGEALKRWEQQTRKVDKHCARTTAEESRATKREATKLDTGTSCSPSSSRLLGSTASSRMMVLRHW